MDKNDKIKELEKEILKLQKEIWKHRRFQNEIKKQILDQSNVSNSLLIHFSNHEKNLKE